MTNEQDARIFAQGRDVAFLVSSVLRPSPKEIKVVAECMRITQAQVRRALARYNAA